MIGIHGMSFFKKKKLKVKLPFETIVQTSRLRMLNKLTKNKKAFRPISIHLCFRNLYNFTDITGTIVINLYNIEMV